MRGVTLAGAGGRAGCKLALNAAALLVAEQPLSSRPSPAPRTRSSSPHRRLLVLQPLPLLWLPPVFAFDSGRKLVVQAGSTALLLSD